MAGRHSDDAPCTIGDMTSWAEFYTETDVIDPSTKLSTKQGVSQGCEWVCVRPLSDTQFIMGSGTDAEASHKIYSRYRTDSGTFDYIVIRSLQPDNSTLEEKYEVIRSVGFNGRNQFSSFSCREPSRNHV